MPWAGTELTSERVKLMAALRTPPPGSPARPDSAARPVSTVCAVVANVVTRAAAQFA